MRGKIIVVLFLVLILGIVIYVFQSGALGKIGASAQTLFKSFPKSSYGTTVAGPSSYPNSGITSGGPTGPATTTTIPGTNTAIYLSDIPAGFTASQLSPYFHQVRFDGITPASIYSSPGSYGETVLASNLSASSTVDITGWQIKSRNSGEYIPQAVNLYDPSGLTALGDIRLQNSQYVYLYSSSGPFNLRLNECIGYVAGENHFTPSLPENCPLPDQSAIQNLTGECQNFIHTIGECQNPSLNNAPISIDDYACRNYVENNFNYLSCFNAHRGDANFLSNQWWVWMGASPFDHYHDTVELLDRNGLLVDVYSY